jgi:ABC-2 type transport system permease protein
MLNSIFSKTLYEKRWGIVWWGLAMFLTTLLVMLLFPVMSDSFGAQLKDVPESLKSILGEAADYQKISGFVELQVLAQMMFLTIIYGIILCVATLSGEENQGTLQTLLAQPVSRSRIYWHKLAACVVVLTLISILMAAGILLGAAVLGESISTVTSSAIS